MTNFPILRIYAKLATVIIIAVLAWPATSFGNEYQKLIDCFFNNDASPEICKSLENEFVKVEVEDEKEGSLGVIDSGQIAYEKMSGKSYWSGWPIFGSPSAADLLIEQLKEYDKSLLQSQTSISPHF